MLPLPIRELQCAMAAVTKSGRSYYILVHGDEPGEVPVHTGMRPETFEHVARFVDHRRAGVGASGYHVLEEEDDEEEDELPGLDQFRWVHTIPYHIIPCSSLPYHTIPYHTPPYHTIPYHTPPYHTIPCRDGSFDANPELSLLSATLQPSDFLNER